MYGICITAGRTWGGESTSETHGSQRRSLVKYIGYLKVKVRDKISKTPLIIISIQMLICSFDTHTSNSH